MKSQVKIEGKLVKGIFRERITRFSAMAKVGQRMVLCFLPNPGRLKELLIRNAKLVLRKTPGGNRKTSYEIVAVFHGDQIVSIDSRLPNRLVLEALRRRNLSEFSNYSIIWPEHSYGNARFDFLLSDGSAKCLLEVKSCTLVRDGVAMFPDAPTTRGVRHVQELARVVANGYRAAVLFIIQRIDAQAFMPNDEMDPTFGRALREAANAGVEIYAYSSEFLHDSIILKDRVHVSL